MIQLSSAWPLSPAATAGLFVLEMGSAALFEQAGSESGRKVTALSGYSAFSRKSRKELMVIGCGEGDGSK